MAGIPFLLQVVLLVLWYTIMPTLPAWLVFLPSIVCGVGIVIALIALVVAAAR